MNLSLLEVAGWVGAFLFSICAIPQAWQCYRQGHGVGLSWAFLLCWLFGELLTTAYIWPKRDWPLLVNYATNMACLAVIVRYKLWPRVQTS